VNQHWKTNASVPTAPFLPHAVYFADSDCVEYIREDSLCVYNRIDNFLTLIFDSTQTSLIGFKLNGFREKFDTYMRPLFELNDRQFIDLVSLIEIVFIEVGNNALDAGDERRKNAYKAAIKLARQDSVKFAGSYLGAF